MCNYEIDKYYICNSTISTDKLFNVHKVTRTRFLCGKSMLISC